MGADVLQATPDSTESPTTARRELLLWALLLGAFAPTLVWMVEGWLLPGSYFSHGPLMVLVGAFVLRQRIPGLRAIPREPRPLAIWLLGLILLLHLLSQALMVDSFSGWLLVPALMVMLFAGHGWMRLRHLAAPIGCVFFAVPLPLFVTGKLAYAMKQLATDVTVMIGNLFGMGLRGEGARIWVPGQEMPLWVGDACSGLRSLTALFALGYLFAVFLTPRKLWSRFAFVGIAASLALVANFVRLTILAWIAKQHGTDFASGTAHDLSGYFLYAGTILMLLVFDQVLPGRLPRTKNAEDSPLTASKPAPKLTRRLSVLVVVFGVPTVLLGFYRPANPSGDLGSRFPRELPGFEFLTEHALSENDYSLLGTRDVAWRRYRHHESQRFVDFTAVFHGRNWKSLHPPEICLEAAGLEIRGQELRSVVVDGRETSLTLLRADRAEQSYAVGYLFGGTGYETPSFLGFFWSNVPRALFRLPMSGYLLRVELPFDGDELDPATERILAEFASRALPHLRALVHEERK
jgi:exosortase